MSLAHHLALQTLPGIGDVRTKMLIEHFNSAENLFRNIKDLQTENLPGLQSLMKQLKDSTVQSLLLSKAEKELEFCEKHKIDAIPFTDPRYPELLRTCPDGPSLLFSKGEINWDNQRFLAVVGTRKATAYGKAFCEHLVSTLKPYRPIIVSGLAHGVDCAIHKACIDQGVSTIAVLGHGLDRIYPAAHRGMAAKILQNGGLISDFWSGTATRPENFPKRNRIVAGMCEATIIVEAAIKGGAMVTAQLAQSYQREIYAVPGKINDPYSTGCNHLIKTQKANLLDLPEELPMELGWEPFNLEKKFKQSSLLQGVEAEKQRKILRLLDEKKRLHLDSLCDHLQLSGSDMLTELLQLELLDKIKSEPGDYYMLKPAFA